MHRKAPSGVEQGSLLQRERSGGNLRRGVLGDIQQPLGLRDVVKAGHEAGRVREPA